MKESDRGCVIFSSGILDSALEDLLRANFQKDASSIKRVISPLFKGYGPLTTFSAKINVSFALGLIDEKVKDKLEIIRRVRNVCAHEIKDVNFLHEQIKKRFDTFLSKTTLHDKEALETIVDVGSQKLSKAQLTDRLIFILNVWDLLNALELLADMSEHHFSLRIKDADRVMSLLKRTRPFLK